MTQITEGWAELALVLMEQSERDDVLRSRQLRVIVVYRKGKAPR